MRQLNPLTNDEDQVVHVTMTPREFIDFMEYSQGKTTQRPERRILKGLAGICELFQCSRSEAFKIAHSEWFQPAKVQVSRRIVFDANLAWELAHNQTIKPAD